MYRCSAIVTFKILVQLPFLPVFYGNDLEMCNKK